MNFELYKSNEKPPPKDKTIILAYFIGKEKGENKEKVIDIFCSWENNKWIFYNQPFASRGLGVLDFLKKQNFFVENNGEPILWIDKKAYNDFCIKKNKGQYKV